MSRSRRFPLLAIALLAGLCLSWTALGSDALAGRRVVKPTTSATGSRKVKVRNAVTAYRGLYVAPRKYDPKKFANKWAFRDGKHSVVSWDQIHVHTRLNGAVGYATNQGLTNKFAKARGNSGLRESVVIEFGLPNRLLKWDSPGAERAHFKRGKVPDDLAYVERIGVLRQRKPSAAQMKSGRFQSVTRGNSKRFIEWMSPDAFFARYPKTK